MSSLTLHARGPVDPDEAWDRYARLEEWDDAARHWSWTARRGPLRLDPAHGVSPRRLVHRPVAEN